MVQSQYSLCWDSYKNSICSGFSTLQQNGEFVDMTLAADGHFVKVHQVLMAMASPYIKELIASLPSQQNPIIFLTNVSYKTLCLLLEYVYTGEVLIPADCLTTFAATAKALHIRGIENITDINYAKNDSFPQSNNTKYNNSKNSLPTQILGQAHFSADTKNSYVKSETSSKNIKSMPIIPTELEFKGDADGFDDTLDDSGTHDDNDYLQDRYSSKETHVPDNSVLKKVTSGSLPNLQYTVSIRGSLQMILNRFIYNLNSSVVRSGIKRWRCVEYRNNKCSAFVTTKNNIVVNRGNLHNHGYHDKKILAKVEKQAVFSELEEVEAFIDREGKKDLDHDTTMEDFD